MTVYIAQVADSELVKIGSTRFAPAVRLHQISYSEGLPMRLLREMPGLGDTARDLDSIGKRDWILRDVSQRRPIAPDWPLIAALCDEPAWFFDNPPRRNGQSR